MDRRFEGAGFNVENAAPITPAAAFVLACAVSAALWGGVMLGVYLLLQWAAG